MWDSKFGIILKLVGFIVIACLFTFLCIKDVLKNGCYADAYWGNKDKDGNYKSAHGK